MILSLFEIDIKRESDGVSVAIVAVEAVSKAIAESVARLIVLDRCGLQPADGVIETRLVVQGLNAPVGDDWRDRSRIKRKAARWRAGLARLDAEERQAVLAALLRQEVPGRSAVLVRAGSGGDGPSPFPLIPIRSRLVIFDEAQRDDDSRVPTTPLAQPDVSREIAI